MRTVLLYIDPGNGSYLVQMIIAAVLGALFYIKTLWWKIKSFFTKGKKEDPPDASNPSEIPKNNNDPV